MNSDALLFIVLPIAYLFQSIHSFDWTLLLSSSSITYLYDLWWYHSNPPTNWIVSKGTHSLGWFDSIYQWEYTTGREWKGFGVLLQD